MEVRTYTEKSNARRAARAAGVDPNLVFATEDGFTFTPPPEANGSGDFTPETFNGPAIIEKTDDDLAIPDFLQRPAPTAEERKALDAKVRRSNPRERKIVMPKASRPAKAKKDRIAKTGDKSALLVSMLQGRGASVAQLTKALGWLPHTLRARISRLGKAKAKGGEGFKIERERKDDVTTYRIAA